MDRPCNKKNTKHLQHTKEQNFELDKFLCTIAKESENISKPDNIHENF